MVKDGTMTHSAENYANYRETFYDMEATDIPSNFSSSYLGNSQRSEKNLDSETKNPLKRKASDLESPDLETPSSKRVKVEPKSGDLSQPEIRTPLTADAVKEHNLRTGPEDKKQSTIDFVLEQKQCEMPGFEDDME